MKRFLYAGFALALLAGSAGLGFAAKTAATPDSSSDQVTHHDCAPCAQVLRGSAVAIPASLELAEPRVNRFQLAVYRDPILGETQFVSEVLTRPPAGGAMLLAEAETVSPTPAVKAGDGDDDSSGTDVKEIIDRINEVQTVWKTAGWLAGLTTLVALLLWFTKVTFIGVLLEKNQAKWVRPLLAMILAGLGAAAAAVTAHANLPTVILLAVGAGVMAPGADQVFQALLALFSKRKREQLKAKELAAAAAKS